MLSKISYTKEKQNKQASSGEYVQFYEWRQFEVRVL